MTAPEPTVHPVGGLPAPGDVAEPQTIDRDDRLAAACAHWRSFDAIALDTEFVRERTYYPQLGLVQVGDGERNVLIDPLAVDDLRPLAELLTDPGVVKVLHSASEDLEVFYRAVGAVPEPLFDTQVAAAFAGLGPSIGYRALVATLTGHDLPKGETRTNWLRRPLSAAQQRYAAQDVAYLLPAYRHLADELHRLGREEWFREEMESCGDTSRFELPPEVAWERIRGAGRLDRRQLAILRELAAWREAEARRRDLPRGFVVTDRGLLAVARARPDDPRRLASLDGLEPAAARRHGEALVACVAAARELETTELPAPRRGPDLPHKLRRDVLKAMKQVVRREADALDLPPELLASSSVLGDVLDRHADTADDEGAEDARALAGWRRELLAAPLGKTIDRHLG